MRIGYLEMAAINLSLALEQYRLEVEASGLYDLPIAEVK